MGERSGPGKACSQLVSIPQAMYFRVVQAEDTQGSRSHWSEPLQLPHGLPSPACIPH